MTPFGAFLDKGIAVLASSNYDIVEGLRSLTWSNLLTNIGLYVLVVYWGSYLVLGVIFSQIDKIKLKGDPIQSVIKAIELEESYAMPVQQDSNASFTRGPSGFPASPNVRSLQICVDASSFADLRSVPQVLPSRFRTVVSVPPRSSFTKRGSTGNVAPIEKKKAIAVIASRPKSAVSRSGRERSGTRQP